MYIEEGIINTAQPYYYVVATCTVYVFRILNIHVHTNLYLQAFVLHTHHNHHLYHDIFCTI